METVRARICGDPVSYLCLNYFHKSNSFFARFTCFCYKKLYVHLEQLVIVIRFMSPDQLVTSHMVHVLPNSRAAISFKIGVDKRFTLIY